ncbi:hypothetical protein ACFX14_026175 [Malus domestica]
MAGEHYEAESSMNALALPNVVQVCGTKPLFFVCSTKPFQVCLFTARSHYCLFAAQSHFKFVCLRHEAITVCLRHEAISSGNLVTWRSKKQSIIFTKPLPTVQFMRILSKLGSRNPLDPA